MSVDVSPHPDEFDAVSVDIDHKNMYPWQLTTDLFVKLIIISYGERNNLFVLTNAVIDVTIVT